MEWKTSLSYSSAEETSIRGKNLLELMENLSFTETIFLLLKGDVPTEQETKLLNAMFVSVIDHGITPPSAMTTRLVISGGTPLNNGVAAGMLSFGKYHAGAIEACAQMLYEQFTDSNDIESDVRDFVQSSIESKKRIPGFGHKIYEKDPRATKLFEMAEQLGFQSNYIKAACLIEQELEKQKGKKFPLNIDGALAALLLTLGMPWQSAQAFFIIPRTVGLCAHGIEEILEDKQTYRRLENDEIEYTG